MEPTAFDEANAILDPPPGVSQDKCQSLVVCKALAPYTDGSPPAAVVISCWKPTARELAEIQRTGRVWLMVWGHTAPPVALFGETPFMAQTRGENAP